MRKKREFTKVYIYDVIFCSKEWESHLQYIEIVFSILKEAGLTEKLRKCDFAMKECTYFGHI